MNNNVCETIRFCAFNIYLFVAKNLFTRNVIKLPFKATILKRISILFRNGRGFRAYLLAKVTNLAKNQFQFILFPIYIISCENYQSVWRRKKFFCFENLSCFINTN